MNQPPKDYNYQVPYNPYMPPSSTNQEAILAQGSQHLNQNFSVHSNVAPEMHQYHTDPSSLTEPISIENIIRLNRGKIITVYMTFKNSKEWNAKVFNGIIETSNKEYIIISEPTTSTRILLPINNLDYATFDEPIDYKFPFVSAR